MAYADRVWQAREACRKADAEYDRLIMECPHEEYREVDDSVFLEDGGVTPWVAVQCTCCGFVKERRYVG